MTIKLIALDLDGTLLNSKKQISDKTISVLQTCIAKGINIVPSTGRSIDGIPDALKNLEGIRYAIVTNGAMVVDLIEKTVIDSRMLSNEKALEIIDIIDSMPAMYDPYIDGRGITQAKFYDYLEDYGLPSEVRGLVYQTRDIVPDIREYVRESKKPVEKINLFFGDLSERKKAKPVLEKIEDIVVSSSLYNNLEINTWGATKGNGLECLASHLGISISETMAFGDGSNDITMIKQAGMGIAMGNAHIQLKKIADYVTVSNDEDGVAAAIEKLVLN